VGRLGEIRLLPLRDRSAAKRLIACANLRVDLLEVVHVLEMVRDRLLEVRVVDTAMWAGVRENPGNVEPELAELFERSRLIRREIEILIKLVYHYLYGIHELLDVEGLSSALSKELLGELDRVLVLRHKLVVHRDQLTVYMRAGSMSHVEDLDQRFGIALVEDVGTFVAETERLWEKALMALPSLSAEENVYERVKRLYEEFDALPGALRAEVKAHLGRYGTESDSPRVLAKLVLAIGQSCLG
jgi:hypothetical protein